MQSHKPVGLSKGPCFFELWTSELIQLQDCCHYLLGGHGTFVCPKWLHVSIPCLQVVSLSLLSQTGAPVLSLRAILLPACCQRLLDCYGTLFCPRLLHTDNRGCKYCCHFRLVAVHQWQSLTLHSLFTDIFQQPLWEVQEIQLYIMSEFKPVNGVQFLVPP